MAPSLRVSGRNFPMTRRHWRASVVLSALLVTTMLLSPRADQPVKLQAAVMVPVTTSGGPSVSKEELQRPRPAQTTTMTAPAPRPASQPVSRGVPRFRPTPPSTTAPVPAQSTAGGWLVAEASWYGPGFYGHGTACGRVMSTALVGVAHKTLPCGTAVTFMFDGRTVTVPVVDRGPYIRGRMWDLTYAACRAISHCFTEDISYRIES